MVVGLSLLCIIYGFLLLFFFNYRLKQKLEKRSAELKKTELRFQELFNNMQDGVAIYEATADGNDFIIKDLNPSGLATGKVQKANIVGKSVREVFPGVEDFGLFDIFKRV